MIFKYFLCDDSPKTVCHEYYWSIRLWDISIIILYIWSQESHKIVPLMLDSIKHIPRMVRYCVPVDCQSKSKGFRVISVGRNASIFDNLR